MDLASGLVLLFLVLWGILAARKMKEQKGRSCGSCSGSCDGNCNHCSRKMRF